MSNHELYCFQIFIIPVLIGLLFELLVIVPMRVPIDESPVFLLYQDWALGLIFLKIWTRLVRLQACAICVQFKPSVTIGRLYGIAAILEAIPSLCRQFFSGMKHLMTMVKVAFLLVIELGVFPLMCGWWLDVCTLKMLGTTIAQRVEFFTMSPLASSSIHWLVGIVYMLQISIFVSLLRGVLLSSSILLEVLLIQ